MIEFLSNFDSAFFSVAVEGLTKDDKIDVNAKSTVTFEQSPAEEWISQRITSLTITEETGAMITGQIQLYEDDNFSISFLLKQGAMVKIWWGYKNKDQSMQDAYVRQENSQELFKSGMLARYCEGYINSPSWAMGQDGKIVYSVGFMCYGTGYLASKTSNAYYVNMTKKDVVEKVFKEMGITSDNMFVKFKRGTEYLNGYTAIYRAGQGCFAFLNQYSMEWRTVFRVGYNPRTKVAVGLFCDFEDDTTVGQYNKATTGASGSSVLWEYKTGKKNVLSAQVKFTSSGGSGDNVMIRMVNGKPEIFRYQASTEGVTYKKLNTDRMNRDLIGAGDIEAQMSLMTQWLSANNFSQVEKYFDDVQSNTAPQGIGLQISFEAIGNPLCSPPARAQLGKGFPDIVQRLKKITFYMTRVTHKIDAGGYKMSVEVADCFGQGGMGVR